MKITCIKDRRKLPSVAEWNRLAAGSPFRSWEWLCSWWETIGSDVELMALLVHADSGDLVGIAPWYVDISRSKGRVLKTFGDGKVCSDYAGIMLDPVHASEATIAIDDWLRRSGSGGMGRQYNWDALDFDGVAESDSMTHLVLDQIFADSRFDKCSSSSTWTVPLPNTWGEYLSTRSKRRRNVLRRMERQMIDSGRASVRFASSTAEVDEFFRALVQLHTQRRQDLGCSGCFSHDRFEEFLQLASRRLFDTEKLWLTQMTIDGEVAASSMGIREADAVYLYQCGIAPQFAELKPGWIQNIFNLQHAIDLGIPRFDFLRGDDAYKQQLGGVPSELFRYRGASPALVSRVRHDISIWAKSAFRSLPWSGSNQNL